MNNSNLRESDKEEGTTNGGKNINPKPTLTTSSWKNLKDPRIVRVSRAFGGKDRHSKVCTVRGLRDRRVRLSVPTAIQLYDLQDRLGLNQPSKVVDWLLDVAKQDINELPPLQIPSEYFSQGLQSMINVASQSENLQGVKTSNNGLNWDDYWNPGKSKEKDHFVVQPSNESSSLPANMFNNVGPSGSFLKLNPSNLSLSQFGSSYGAMVPAHQENTNHNFNINGSGSHQLLGYPSSSHDQNSRQLNFEMMSSSSSSSHNPMSPSSLYTINQGMVRPFPLSMNPRPFSLEENEQDGGN